MLQPKIKLNFFLMMYLLLLIVSCKKENTNNINTNNTFIENQFLDKKYDEVCFIMTHNAMNAKAKNYAIPNQTFSITQQLKDGVRGLMID